MTFCNRRASHAAIALETRGNIFVQLFQPSLVVLHFYMTVAYRRKRPTPAQIKDTRDALQRLKTAYNDSWGALIHEKRLRPISIASMPSGATPSKATVSPAGISTDKLTN